MKNIENNIEDSAKDALFACLSKIPFLKITDIKEDEYRSNNIEADLAIKIQLPDTVISLIGEIKNSGQPRLAREAVNQMLRYKDKLANAYFVFIAPYISPKAADICVSEGVGYLDLSGNCLLSFDKIFIEKKDYPNQFKEKRIFRSLYTPKAERILRVLLCNPGRNWKIKELADESGISLGQASNVKKILYDREFISGERGGFSLEDPASLLREWAENYDYRKNRIQEYYSLKSIPDIEKLFSEFCIKNEIKYALTGFSGAARIALAIRYNKAMIYVSDFTEELLSDIPVKEVSSGGNLLLFTPYDDGVFYGSSKVDDIQIASKVQLYLDLHGFRGRGEEAAEMLYERIVEE